MNREQGNTMVDKRALDVQRKRVTVVGLGRSGAAACKLLVSRGALVTGSDHRPAEEIETNLADLERRGVRCEFGRHRLETFLQADLIILSPGVESNLPLLQQARSQGVRVWSEVELAFRATEASFVAITGTNGKSTTTTLIGLMVKHAGKKAIVAGNIGTALCDVVPGLSPEYWVVAEISSFQLETIEAFRPQVALLLNVTPDHLDRYADLAQYSGAKARIFLNQQSHDMAILNADDPLTVEAGAQGKARQIFFSQRQAVKEGAFLKEETFWLRLGGKGEAICSRQDLKIRGAHNTENVLAALAAAGLLGVPSHSMREVLKQFGGLEHRLEAVAEIAGVQYINDSKGTNVGATVKSLESFPAGKVVLIAGGLDKGADFRPLIPPVKERVKATILIGQAREKLQATLQGVCPVQEAASLEGAVEAAATLAAQGDVVLLSPACASFDMFRDFEERGRAYKAAVKRLRD
ncbi:MAG: UDP-N-acetylmuramoyl-L-alanine--D-glutamate ligase [candidate division NC10 bacterium]|nr:UDP-N-acetylmuramoyl-L-alanine--D-glutamate ligase [candidate division NC10 bacterium]